MNVHNSNTTKAAGRADVLPTPGGPTRHMILPCTDS